MPLRQLKVPRHDARHFFLIETRSPPGLLAPTLVTLPSMSRAPRRSIETRSPPGLLAPTLVTLPSMSRAPRRSIETRSPPGLLAPTLVTLP